MRFEGEAIEGEEERGEGEEEEEGEETKKKKGKGKEKEKEKEATVVMTAATRKVGVHRAPQVLTFFLFSVGGPYPLLR